MAFPECSFADNSHFLLLSFRSLIQVEEIFILCSCFVLVPEKLKGQIKQKAKGEEDGPVGIFYSILISFE